MVHVRPDVLIIPISPPGPPVGVHLTGSATLGQVSGGSSGWQIVDRPRQYPATQWYGGQLSQIVLAVTLDIDSGAGVSIQGYLDAIMSWTIAAAGQNRPPVLRLTGPIPATDLRWVLYSASWDDVSVIRNAKGVPLQASIKLTFYEYRPLSQASVAAASPAKAAHAARSGSAKGTTRHYTVRSGDTLSTIAAALLGSYADWPKIAKANSLRDPNYLQVGQVLSIP